jgi:hypothetical protein
MLTLPKKFPAAVTAKCMRCPTTTTLPTAASLDDARSQLKSMKWLECPRAGAGVKNWPWMCPTCNPELKPRPKTMGRTTP